jgi:hypothetical protein
MDITEALELLICDDESTRIAQSCIRIVLARDDQDLETLPPKQGKLADGFIHVLVDVYRLTTVVILNLTPYL